MKATPISTIGAALVLFVSVAGCSARAPVPADASSPARAATDLAPGKYELWTDHRCRREARRFSHLGDDAYMAVETEKRFVVYRTEHRILLRAVDAPSVELEAVPHDGAPGVYAIRGGSGGMLTVREGPRERRAEVVLFGTSRPYLACDRGALRTVAAM